MDCVLLMQGVVLLTPAVYSVPQIQAMTPVFRLAVPLEVYDAC
jgi:hypothetical protein